LCIGAKHGHKESFVVTVNEPAHPATRCDASRLTSPSCRGWCGSRRSERHSSVQLLAQRNYRSGFRSHASGPVPRAIATKDGQAIACLISLVSAGICPVRRIAVPAHSFEVIDSCRSIYPHDNIGAGQYFLAAISVENRWGPSAKADLKFRISINKPTIDHFDNSCIKSNLPERWSSAREQGHDTLALQAYLGHRNIQHTVRYTEPSPTRFKDFWRD
jgi:hypothetical protein